LIDVVNAQREAVKTPLLLLRKILTTADSYMEALFRNFSWSYGFGCYFICNIFFIVKKTFYQSQN